jgi:GT2 family glycosyltransferase
MAGDRLEGVTARGAISSAPTAALVAQSQSISEESVWHIYARVLNCAKTENRMRDQAAADESILAHNTPATELHVLVDPDSHYFVIIGNKMNADRSPGRDTNRRYKSHTLEFTPLQILEVDIDKPLPAVEAHEVATGQSPRRALALVRLHTRPIGVVELQYENDGLGAEGLADQIWQALRTEITAHLRRDGLLEPSALEASGMQHDGTPTCVQERNMVLTNAPFVSVGVATRDRPTSLAICLRSLLSLEYPNFEIIVVDNAPSTDATADFIGETYGDMPQIRYVREDRPGLARAHNRGLREGRGEIVAFTDDDVVVDKYWLAELVKGFTVTKDVACVTGMIFPMELQTQAQAWIEQYGGFSKGYDRRVFNLAENRPHNRLFPYAAGAFGSGANMAFQASALRAIGGFDPALGAGSPGSGGDDLAAFFQIIMAGQTLVYEPGAIVHHLHRRDYAGLRKQMFGYGVGLTAYLTKCLVDKPALLLDVAARIPEGLKYAFSPRSPKNIRKLYDYPRELTRLERMGMLYGPLAYLRGRCQTRDRPKTLGSLSSLSPSSIPLMSLAEDRIES